MIVQPLNNLAPFQVVDRDGNIVIKIEEDGGLTVQYIKFPDGSGIATATQLQQSSKIDSGTF